MCVFVFVCMCVCVCVCVLCVEEKGKEPRKGDCRWACVKKASECIVHLRTRQITNPTNRHALKVVDIEDGHPNELFG